MDQLFNLLVALFAAVILWFSTKAFVESLFPFWPFYSQRLQDIAAQWACAHQRDDESACEKTFQDMSALCRKSIVEDRHGMQLVLLVIVRRRFGKEIEKKFLEAMKRHNREKDVAAHGKP